MSALGLLGLAVFAVSTMALWSWTETAANAGTHFIVIYVWVGVLSVLVPAAVYVLAIQLVGIYIASAVYIAGFMIILGKFSKVKSILLGLAVAVFFFGHDAGVGAVRWEGVAGLSSPGTRAASASPCAAGS